MAPSSARPAAPVPMLPSRTAALLLLLLPLLVATLPHAASGQGSVMVFTGPGVYSYSLNGASGSGGLLGTLASMLYSVTLAPSQPVLAALMASNAYIIPELFANSATTGGAFLGYTSLGYNLTVLKLYVQAGGTVVVMMNLEADRTRHRAYFVMGDSAQTHDDGRAAWRDAYSQMSEIEMRVREKQLDLNNETAELQRMNEELKRSEKELSGLTCERDEADQAMPLLRLKLLECTAQREAETADMHRMVQQLRGVQDKLEEEPKRQGRTRAQRDAHVSEQVAHVEHIMQGVAHINAAAPPDAAEDSMEAEFVVVPASDGNDGRQSDAPHQGMPEGGRGGGGGGGEATAASADGGGDGDGHTWVAGALEAEDSLVD